MTPAQSWDDEPGGYLGKVLAYSWCLDGLNSSVFLNHFHREKATLMISRDEINLKHDLFSDLVSEIPVWGLRKSVVEYYLS